MRLLYSFFGFCATVLMCWSCTTDTTEELGLGNGYVTLTLTTGSATRADENLSASAASESDYHEDKIDRVDLFIFPGADAATGTQPKYVTLTPGLNGKADISFRFEMEEFEKFFPNNASGSCELYAFVNLTEDDITALKAKNKGAYDDYVVTATQFKSKDAPDKFVMTSGMQTLNYNAENKTFTVPIEGNANNTTIKVTRLAAKIRMAVKINYVYTDDTGAPLTPPEKPADEATEEEKSAYEAAFTEFKSKVAHTIIPSTKNDGTPADMLLFIQDGVVRGQLSGEPLTNEKLAAEVEGKNGYYDVPVGSTKEDGARVLAKPGEGDREAPEGYQYYNKIPYYSYPNEWDNISSEEHNTSLTLQVLWEEHSGYIPEEGKLTTRNDDVEPFETWYSIPVNYNGNKLKANHYYRIKLHVTAVGSQSQHEPTKILDNAECEILDWAQSDDINVEIKDSRFLIVEKENWSMGTDETIEIPYITSHKTVWRPIEKDKYEIKVSYTSANKPSTKVNQETMKINTPQSRAPFYWGGGELPLELSSSDSNEYTYTTEQNNNSESMGGESIYTYNITSDAIIFNHPLRSMTALDASGATTTDANAVYFKSNGGEDLRSYNIEIKIIHEDMVGNQTLENGKKLEDIWTRNIYITQGALPISVKSIDRFEFADESKLQGNYGFWYSYVTINGINGTSDGFDSSPTASSSFNTNITKSMGGLGLSMSILGKDTKKSELDLITRDLYRVTVDKSFETNNNLNLKDANNFGERDRIQGELRNKIRNNSDLTVKVGSKIYRVGDPRSPYVNNTLGEDDSNSALITATSETPWNTPTMSDGYQTDPYNSSQRKLAHYYPTLEDGSVSDMVSPIFLVSSSFGDIIDIIYSPKLENNYYIADKDVAPLYESQGITRTQARRRCSAYQELFRAAGRWRLPTKSEMELIATLTASNIMMSVFDPNKKYWTADGLYQANSDGTVSEVSEEKGYVKCVYDDWYWIDRTCDYNVWAEFGGHQFFWGDRQWPN